MRMRLSGRIGVILAFGYLAVVVGVETARRSGRGPAPENLSSSPARVATGQLWQLVTSAFVIAGDPLVQLALALLLVVTVLARLGAGTFWRAAFAGHIVATLVVYCCVGVLWVLERKDVDAVVDAPDYGISCVIAAAAGALVAGAGWRWRWSALLCATALLAAAWSFATSRDGLAGSEHLLAFMLGGLVGRRAQRQRTTAPPLGAASTS